MKKAIRISIVAACLGIMFLSISAVQSQAQVMREILDRMDRYNKALTSMQSDVTMVKTNTQLNIPETTSGKLSYISKTNPKSRGMMWVRINWTKPVEEQILVIGDEYQLYRPRLNQVIEGKTDKAKNSGSVGGALGFMSMSRDQLRANYEAVLVSPDPEDLGGTRAWHLQLTPKTQTSYKSAELWIDANGAPLQTKITERNGDTTVVRLTNRKENASVSTSEFKLQLPKGVKIVPGG